MSMPRVVSSAIFAFAFALVSTSASAQANAPAKVSLLLQLSGKVHGGLTALPGSSVQIYAAGTAGYGSAAAPLLNTPAMTNAAGNFTVNQAISVAPTALLYAVASGGNGGHGNNPAIAMIQALGPANTLSVSTSVVINEASTVAAAYALAQYTVDPTHIGSTNTTLGQQGITNAFALANLLVVNGAATAPTATVVYPQQLIDFLANGLAYCVNSNPGLGVCQVVFADTKSASGTTPANTAQAAINIAQNHQLLGTSYTLLTGSQAPFQPTLGTEPNDAAMVIAYPLGGLYNQYQTPAIDGTGNVFLADAGGNVVKLDPYTGNETFVSGSGFYPRAVAIDNLGNVYAAGGGNTGFVEYQSDLSLVTSLPTNSLLESIAFDGNNTLWSNDTSGNLYFTPVGNHANGLGGTITTHAPSADTTGALFLTVLPGGYLAQTEYTVSTAFAVGIYSYNLAQASGPSYFATVGLPAGHLGQTAYNASADGKGDFYMANDSLAKVTLPNGVETDVFDANTNAPYTGGYQVAGGIAIDGLGNLWGTNHQTACTVFGFTTTPAPLSPSVGLGDLIQVPNCTFQYPPVIDGSGNLWASYSGHTNVAGQSGIVEYVGLAAPVVTPLVATLATNQTAVRP